MSFLNPALLFGFLAVSVPIIIHLLNRRRFRKVPWAAMRFLNISVEQNQRRMKLEDLILLLLRCAMVALLALALARPVVDALRGMLPGSNVATAIIIDTSASMGTVEDGETRLARAREAARTVLGGLSSGSAAAILTPFEQHEATTDRELALRRIDEAPATDRHGDLLTALERAAVVLESQAAAAKEIHLVTDGQAVEWSAFSAIEEKLRELSAGMVVHVVLVGDGVPANLGITRLVPSSALPAVGKPFRIDLDVTNFGLVPVVDVPVQLEMNGRPAGEPWVIDEIAPGESESATLYATMPAAGYHRIMAVLPGDAVPFDDRRALVVRAMDDVRVLLVDGEPGADPRQAETFFLRHALAPVPAEERDAYPVKPVVVPVSGLEGQTPGDFDAIVLANVSDVPLPVSERLAHYVEGGGGLLVFPGENVREVFYNSVLHAKHALLPAALVSHRPVADGEPLAMQGTETNPLGLDDDLLRSVRFRRTWQLGDPSARSRTALRFSDGAPALVESDRGLGKVFLFTSTADTAWSNFAVKPAFVPFVNRLLGMIVQQRDAGLNLEAGEPLAHVVDAGLGGREATVFRTGDEGALGMLTEVEKRETDAILRFAGTSRGGIYEASITGAVAPVVFAVRPSPRESSTELLAEEQTARLAEHARVIHWASGGGASEFGKDRNGAELWLVLLLVVIALAVIEIALAQWFSRPK